MLERKQYLGAAAAGLLAGVVNGIFGGAGGMVLIPALQWWAGTGGEDLFPMSVRVMLPICVLSLFLGAMAGPLPWRDAMPYLAGSIIGGVLAGAFGKKIPTVWLHRVFGAMILWGGIRYLC